MSREKTLLLLAILIALSPFVGLPYSVLMWVVPILALLVAVVGARPRSRVAPPHEAQ